MYPAGEMNSQQTHALGDYTSYLKIERAMSPNTAAAYGSDIASFLGFIGEDVRLEDITPDDIIACISSKKNSSPRSQARFLSSLKSFFNYLIAEKVISENPCDRVDAPKIGRHLPAVLSVEEVDRIMDSVPLNNAAGVRDRAILEVLYGCGLRVSEAVSLKISDISFKEKFVRIVGKGNKQRLVPIGDVALEFVLKYLDVRPQPYDKDSEDILFLNKSGKSLSRVSVFNLVKRQAMLAGIHKEISPHTFRHSFATHLIENGADLRVVQEMLGHESVLTTEIYTHIDASKWQSTVLAHHPRK